MESRNIYISDLEFELKATQQIKFQDESGKYLAAEVAITKYDEKSYGIVINHCDDKGLAKRLVRQGCGNVTEETADKKLKTIQYWTRKFITEKGEEIARETMHGDDSEGAESSSEEVETQGKDFDQGKSGEADESGSGEGDGESEGEGDGKGKGEGDEGEQSKGDGDGEGEEGEQSDVEGEDEGEGKEEEESEEKPKKKRKTKSKEQRELEKEMQQASEEEESIEDKLEAMKKVIEDKLEEEHNKNQHFKFPLVLKSIKAGVNVALVGPAGSGKTTVVSKCAEKLGLHFYSKSVSAQTGSHEFFGYQDANGVYIRTLFREAYEFGGVFLLDEFDAGNPNVLAALNQATANGSCSFADGMISKHEDFVVVMAGNTFGHGATSEYVGRNKIDAATLDRFAFIEFPYDEQFEMRLAENKEWCSEVQTIREVVGRKKIKTIVSPRATFDGAKLLKAGVSKEDVLSLMIYKGLTEQEVRMLKS